MRDQSSRGLALALLVIAIGGQARGDSIPLVDPTGGIPEPVLEAFLAPGEFPDRTISIEVTGDTAAYALDLGLHADPPIAEFHPDRVLCPDIAGLPLTLTGHPVALDVAPSRASDEALDRGFVLRIEAVPLGQRFDPMPRFEARPISAAVHTVDGSLLLSWSSPKKQPACTRPKGNEPACRRTGIGLEINAAALSPDGGKLAMVFGGLRPRLEVHDITGAPRRQWQALFPKNSGGAVATHFSSDGQWVVALTGRGEMHRFNAETGESHLRIPSRGRSAGAIPPGDIIAVAGDSGEVKLWYLADGTIAWRLPPRSDRGAVDRIASSGNGDRFALLEYTDSGTIIRVVAAQNRSVVYQLEMETLDVSDIALDETGATLFISHESKGLLATPVRTGSVPAAVRDRGAGDCTGQLTWSSKQSFLSCATPTGVSTFDKTGHAKRTYETSGAMDKWIVATATEGARIAAVGGGTLLIWWLTAQEHDK